MKVLLSSICLAVFALSALQAAPAQEASHHLVYAEADTFSGFPANEGSWAWGDEILVAFQTMGYEASPTGHNIKEDSLRRIVFARSLDGGKTWQPERHDNVTVSVYTRMPERLREVAPAAKPPRPLTEPIDFSNPDLALKIRDSILYVSKDRGRVWEGPFVLPDMGLGKLSSRTSYMPTGRDSCLFFFSAANRAKGEGEKGRSFVAQTTDGGLTFEFLGWIGEDIAEGVDPKRAVYSTMPSVVRLDDGSLLASQRRRIGGKNRWTDIFVSADEGRTWEKTATLERGVNNPMALVHMGGNRVVAVYANRKEGELGVVAKVSDDGGRTWSDEYVIRDDAFNWDMGYCRAHLLPDGRILVLYYYTTAEIPNQHIAASLWTPPAR